MIRSKGRSQSDASGIEEIEKRGEEMLRRMEVRSHGDAYGIEDKVKIGEKEG